MRIDRQPHLLVRLLSAQEPIAKPIRETIIEALIHLVVNSKEMR